MYKARGWITILLTVLMVSTLSTPIYADDDPQLRMSSFRIKEKSVINNDLTEVTVKFTFARWSHVLHGGSLLLRVSDANKKQYDVKIELRGNRYRRTTGVGKVKVRLVCSDSPWLKIEAWLVDTKGMKSGKQKLKIKSIKNPKNDGTYKINWPLGVEAHTRMMDFTLLDKDGNKVSLWDYYGKVIFVDFGTMWCGPCEWMGVDINTLYKRWKNNENVVFITVFHEGYTNGEPVTLEDLKKWTSEHKANWIHLADPEQKAWKMYRDPEKATSVPQWMFISNWGIIESKNIGYGPNWFYDAVMDNIKYFINRFF